VALELQIVKATIRWQEFVGAEGYAIVKDGRFPRRSWWASST
jgi:hypothetical protein